MRWFGESWGAPVCEETQHVETPDGEACPVCGRSIRMGDQGFELPYSHDGASWDEPDLLAYHKDCLLRNIGIRVDK